MKLKKLASLAMSGVLCLRRRFVVQRGRIRFGGVRLRFGGGDGQRYSRG